MSDAEAAMSPPDQAEDHEIDDADDIAELSEIDEHEPATDDPTVTVEAEGDEPADTGDAAMQDGPSDGDAEAPPAPAPAPERSEADVLADDLEVDLVGVDDALKRLDDGTYGTCATCGAVLDDASLEANPTTSVCQPACSGTSQVQPATG